MTSSVRLIALSLLLLLSVGTAQATVTRIIVLPFYVEEGADTRDAGADTRHYRRILRYINNQLVRHGFEVLNPFAADLKMEEYNRIMERAREDSALASQEMSRRYAVDVVYLVWLDVTKRVTADGYCKVESRIEGEGYDSAGRSLGAGLEKTIRVTKSECDDAIIKSEKEVADRVGRVLTAWSGRQASGSGERGNGAIAGPSAYANMINVRLDGATEYALAEVFGKVLNTARGVTEATQYRLRIDPENPQASEMIWRVTIEDTDAFRLQANVMNMIHEILEAGGDIKLKGVSYRYTPAEVDLLKGVRPGDVTSREIQFVLDRELVRDRDFSGRYDPYKARERRPSGGTGFD